MIAGLDNLQRAYLKAARGKKHLAEVIGFTSNLAENLERMRLGLVEENVEVGDYRFFTVHDPKLREICAAAFPERVLHHAIMNICEPALEKYAIHHSYACRKDKGSRKALSTAQQYAGQYPFYLKLDIRKYFDSIDHEVLLEHIKRQIKDRKVIDLFATIFATYHTVPGKGLPIGNLVSQHMANFYLGHFDHWIKDDRGVKGYLRYMDDFLVFGNSRQQLKKLLTDIQSFLQQELALELKDNIQLNRCRLGIPFLGYRVYPNRFTLLARSKKRFVEKFVDYEQRYINGDWDEETLADHINPLVEFVRFGDKGGWRRAILDKYGVYPEARTA